MSIYFVVLNEPSEPAWNALKEEWPGRTYILNDRIAFVAPSESERVIVTEDICEALGMDTVEKVNGIVAEINYGAINGWNSKSLWEWLEKVSP